MTGTPTAVPFARWRQASRRGGSCYLDQSQRRGNGVWRASRRLGQRDTGPPGATAGASTPSGPCLHPGPICLSPCDNREVARWGASLALRAVTESFKHNFFPQHTYAVMPGAEAPAQPCEAPGLSLKRGGGDQKWRHSASSKCLANLGCSEENCKS